MKLEETRRNPQSRLRDVSDLRTQFQCEYRFHLKEILGESSSEASVMGSILHSRIAKKSQYQTRHRDGRALPLVIIILTIVVGLFWIFW